MCVCGRVLKGQIVNILCIEGRMGPVAAIRFCHFKAVGAIGNKCDCSIKPLFMTL